MPGDEGGLSARVRAAGHDLFTGDDPVSPRVLAAFTVTGWADPAGVLSDLALTAAVPVELDLRPLAGGTLPRDFHRTLGAFVEASAPAARPLAALVARALGDLPMSLRVARQTFMIDHPAVADGMPVGPEGADACAGWRSDGRMMEIIRSGARLRTRLGPPAPAFGETGNGADPLGWPAAARLPRMATRRLRRVDVDRASGTLDAHFRDGYVDPDGVGRSLHEYTVTGRVRPAAGGGYEIVDLRAVAHALPWDDCFPAVASAGRLDGTAVGAVGDRVRADLRGVTTCTHLNHTLRTLDDVADLMAPI